MVHCLGIGMVAETDLLLCKLRRTAKWMTWSRSWSKTRLHKMQREEAVNLSPRLIVATAQHFLPARIKLGTN